MQIKEYFYIRLKLFGSYKGWTPLIRFANIGGPKVINFF